MIKYAIVAYYKLHKQMYRVFEDKTDLSILSNYLKRCIDLIPILNQSIIGNKYLSNTT